MSIEISLREISRWLVTVCLLAINLGCSGTRKALVEVSGQQEDRVTPSDLAAVEADGAVRDASLPAPPTPSPQPAVVSANGSVAVVTEPAAVEGPIIIELTKQAVQQSEDHVKAAKRMLNDKDLATAAILLEEALRLDPTSPSAASLQRRLEERQRKADEQARRELINRYTREGSEILKTGDVGRALAYFRAAQELDPTNRKPFTLIQQAHATWDKLRARQREEAFEEAFNERLRFAKAMGQAEGRTEAAAPLEERADIPAVPGTLEPWEIAIVSTTAAQPSPQVEQAVALTMPPAVLPSKAAGHPVEVVPTAQLPGASTEPSTGEYTIQPDDILLITVFEEPDLTTKARVTRSGEMAFPLLGHVAVAGLEVAQVQEKLTTLLAADYLVNPQVQVFVDTTLSSRKVFVTGAVNKPGSYAIPIERPTTLMETIAMAGGFSQAAAPNKTRIVRVEEGQEQTIPVHADDIVKKGDKTQDVAVRPNDIIFVPESFF